MQIVSVIGYLDTVRVGTADAKQFALDDMRRKMIAEVDMACIKCQQCKEQTQEMPDHMTGGLRLGLDLRCAGQAKTMVPGNWSSGELTTTIFKACPDGYTEQGNYLTSMEPAPDAEWMTRQVPWREDGTLNMSYDPSIKPVPPRNKDKPQVENVEIW